MPACYSTLPFLWTIFLFIALSIVSDTVCAQKLPPSGAEDAHERHHREFPLQYGPVRVLHNYRQGRSQSTIEGYETVEARDRLAVSRANGSGINGRPELNFDIMGAGQYAGDVNGDGINDYLISTPRVRDERSSDLSDRTGKTALFFGSAMPSSAENQLLYDYLLPAGDLNGDGFDDAIEIGNEYLAIYKGTANGYVSTNATQGIDWFSLPDRTTGFTDLDGDGFEDVLIWEENSNGLRMVLYGGRIWISRLT